MGTPPLLPLAGEFRLIEAYFRPLAGPEALGLTDDAAVVVARAGEEWVVSTDAMVETVHFLPRADPFVLAQKLLRVNLSDLAAMGARPLGYLLTLGLPRDTTDAWLKAFAAGLAHDQKRFGLSLFGGDTTRSPRDIMLSVTIIGAVAAGRAVRRNGAYPGDRVYVTGTVGDGILGLRAAQGEIADPDGALRGRYLLPTPRNALPIADVASAAIDISDGMVQELGHIARASGVAITVEAPQVPLSAAARPHAALLPALLAGGDDYELLMTVPPAREAELIARASGAGVAVTRIGVCTAGGPSVSVRDEKGEALVFESGGWSHF